MLAANVLPMFHTGQLILFIVPLAGCLHLFALTDFSRFYLFWLTLLVSAATFIIVAGYSDTGYVLGTGVKFGIGFAAMWLWRETLRADSWQATYLPERHIKAAGRYETVAAIREPFFWNLTATPNMLLLFCALMLATDATVVMATYDLNWRQLLNLEMVAWQGRNIALALQSPWGWILLTAFGGWFWLLLRTQFPRFYLFWIALLLWGLGFVMINGVTEHLGSLFGVACAAISSMAVFWIAWLLRRHLRLKYAPA
jgi:hypothetical protein